MKKRFVVFLLIFVFAFAITSFRLTAFAEDSVAISSKVSEIELDIGASYDIDDLEIKVDSEGDYSVTYALPDNDTVAALENGVLTALTQGYTEITVTAGSASIVIPVYIDLPEYYYYDSEYLSESIVLQNNGGLNSELLADNGSKYLRVKSEKAVSSGRFDLYTMINPAIAKAYPVLKIVYRSNIGGGTSQKSMRVDCWLDNPSKTPGNYSFKYLGDGSWHSHVSDNSKKYSSNWNSLVTTERLYRGFIFRTAYTAADDYVDVKYMGYFKTEEDANAFDPDKKQYTVNVNAIGYGNVTVDGGDSVKSFSGEYDEGEIISVNAVADKGYRLEGVYEVTDGRNVLLSRSLPYVLEASKSIDIEVRFIDETISLATKLVASVGSGEAGSITVGGSLYDDFSDYADSGHPTMITANANDGYKTAYWLRTTSSSGINVFMSLGDTLEAYPLGTDVYYRPVFVASDAQVKLYIDYAGLVIGEVIGEGEAPELPRRYGYTPTGWSEYLSLDGVTVYKAAYTKETNETLTLTVKYANGVVDSTTYAGISYNDEISLESSLEGVVWTITEIDGKAVEYALSYSEKYSFNYSFTKSMTVEEIAAEDQDAVINGIEAVYLADAAQIKFSGVFELPENAVHVDHGFLLTNNSDIAQDMTVNSPDDVIVGRIRNNTNPTPAFVINKNGVSTGDTWYARAYLVYELDGITYDVYGSTMSATAN
ncbi:MAG: hypothetical protein IJ391_06355 [Clostridia bacterium]|nr:hypothetical protein [Clostridia bacterium]